MSSKINLTIVYICAITNALLINLQLLHIIHLNPWFILSPTWLIVIITFIKAARARAKNILKVFLPVSAFVKSEILHVN